MRMGWTKQASGVIIAALLLAAGWTGAVRADSTIKMATLAPEGSSWMKIFMEFDQELQQKTGGKARFRIYPGGVLGDERDMLRKMHIGQIQAAVFTSAGLSAIFPDMDVFQIPFLFQTYPEVDHVVEKMDAFFRQGLAGKGYVLLGWMEGGFVQLMSTTRVETLADLQQAKVWTWQDSPMAKAIFEEAKVAAIPLSVPDVLVGLQTGLVDVVYAPPTGAIALQWFTRIKYITDLPLIYLLGGLVVKKADYDSISPEHQAVIQEILPRYMDRIKTTIRRENSEAVDVMARQGIQLLKPTAEQIAEFKSISDRAMDRMEGDTFSRETRERVIAYLKAFREANK